MADKKKKNNTPKPSQHYWFTMILYPDCSRHLLFVEKVLPTLPLKVVGILHDRDSIEDDETLMREFLTTGVSFEPSTYDGMEDIYKKPHLHLVLKLPMKRTLAGMKKIITTYGVEDRFIAPCDPFNICSYLTHANAPHKHQYSDKEVFGDIGLYTQYTTYSSNHNFQRFFELLSQVDVEVREGNMEASYIDICFYMHANGVGHLLTGSGNYMYNQLIKEKIKEIKEHGLYQKIPYYGKINI